MCFNVNDRSLCSVNPNWYISVNPSDLYVGETVHYLSNVLQTWAELKKNKNCADFTVNELTDHIQPTAPWRASLPAEELRCVCVWIGMRGISAGASCAAAIEWPTYCLTISHTCFGSDKDQLMLFQKVSEEQSWAPSSRFLKQWADNRLTAAKKYLYIVLSRPPAVCECVCTCLSAVIWSVHDTNKLCFPV